MSNPNNSASSSSSIISKPQNQLQILNEKGCYNTKLFVNLDEQKNHEVSFSFFLTNQKSKFFFINFFLFPSKLVPL